jgi:hypothetical protein
MKETSTATATSTEPSSTEQISDLNHKKVCLKLMDPYSVVLRNGPASRKKTRVCTHKHWKNCYDVPEAHRYEEEALRPELGLAEEAQIALLVSEHRELLEGSGEVTAGYTCVRMT